MPEIGTYVLPVIPSMEGIDASINKSFGDKFKIAGKRAGKDLAAGIGDGLQADLEKAGASYKKLQDKAEDALGKIRAEEAKLQALRDRGASADKVVVAEERLATARRNSTRANSDAQSGLRDLERAQSSLADGVGRSGSIFDGVGAKVSAFGVLAAGAAVGGVALLAAGAVKATSELYDLGAQFDDLSDNLRVGTGATGSALDALTKSVENISKSTPSSIADIGSVVAETTRALHVTGPELEAMSKNIANLNRLTGDDTDVRALGKAFRAFGVDAKDQVPALDSLFNASQHSGLSVNDLIASVVKGGPQLREFGLSFGESAALVGTFEDAGLDADKSTQGLTKALATFAKDGKDPQEALKGTIGEIKNLISAGNDAGALDLTNKVFGAKSGVSFFDAVKSGALDLDTLTSSLSTTGDTIQQASDDTADWSEKWQTLKNKLSVAVEPLASGVFTGINDGLNELSTWVDNHQTEVINAFVTMGDGVITFAEVSVKSMGLFSEGLGQMVAPLGDTLGGLTEFNASVQRLLGRGDIADQLDKDAQSYFSMGEGLTAFRRATKDVNFQGLRDSLHAAGEEARAAADKTGGLGNSIAALEHKSVNIPINVDTTQADTGLSQFFQKWKTAVIDPPVAPRYTPGDPGSLILPKPRAFGGAITGGVSGKDSVPSLLMPGEHVFTRGEVGAAGGQGAMYRLRAAIRSGLFKGFETGGAVGPDVLAAQDLIGTKYSQGQRNDCSGMVARVIDRAMGLPESGLMSTKNAQDWLTARGFRPGRGGPGMISVGWYDHGPNPNDGHMAMTLSDGTNAESGGSHGDFLVGAGAKGADDPQFDQHMFLPQIFGEGPAGSSASNPASAGTTGGGTYTAPDAKTVREGNQKVADAETRVKEAEAKQRELKADAKESEKISAQTDVDKAKRERDDAKADLAETMKGKLTPGKGGSSSQGGLGQFGELGSIAGSFLKETLGIDGSFLPDISSLGIVQTGGALLNAFSGPLQGLMQGQLGIQQPGWSPGMPVNGVAAPSLSPFGMGATQMPGISSGVGTGPAPGPVSIDNSTTINSPTGDPNDIENRIRRTNMNRPRIDSYAIPGT